MRHLELPTHRGRPVTLDHCMPCRLVWFDELESVQLDDLGWVKLLRELQQGDGLPLAQALKARRACPRCAEPMKVVRNRTRFGTFATFECPQRHGHLHGHSGLLAERGLVRPLGLAERKALAAERHALRCLNCGGPAGAADEHCSWCGTALVVIDLPRLAHAIRLRSSGMGESPAVPGQRVTWACHGCGAALDPGRDAQCPHCEHLVVAQRLPDIEPMLAEAEAELAAVAQAQALRLVNYPSQQPEALARARPQPQSIPRATVAAAPSRLPWRGWLPLWVLLAAAVLLGLGAGSVLWKQASGLGHALLAHPLGGDPERAWALADDYLRLRPADRQGLLLLRQGLIDRQARLLLGEAPAALTVGELVEWQRQGGADERAALQQRWSAAMARQLRFMPGFDSGALPADAAAVARRLEPAAPGIWMQGDSRARAWWTPEFDYGGNLPLPVAAPLLRMRVGGGNEIAWRCEPVPGSEPLVLVGKRLKLHCATAVEPRQQDTAWRQAMGALGRGDAPQLEWAEAGFDQPRRWESVVDHLVAWAAGRTVPWESRYYKGPRRSGAALALLVLAGALVAFVVYGALQQRLGERRAGVAVMLLAAVPAWWAGRGEGAASVLLVGGYLALATIVVFGYAYVWRLYRIRALRRLA